MPGVPTLTVKELAARRQRGDDLILIDVREPHEWSVARIDGATLVPLRTIPQAAGTLDRDRDLVVYCHTGVRSGRAVEYLRQLGFDRAWNLAGGIHAWSLEIDPSVPVY